MKSRAKKISNILVFGFSLCVTFASYCTDKISSKDDLISRAIEEVTQEFFSASLSQEMSVESFVVGYSQAAVVLVYVDGKKYVLKVYGETELSSAIEAELQAQQDAARMRLAPEIYYITKNRRGILMEYIEGGTISVTQLQQHENVEKMAHAMRQIHEMKPSSYPLTATARNMHMRVVNLVLQYKDMFASLGMCSEIEGAIASMYDEYENLALFDSPKRMIHGDVHPRNICITQEKVVFIDWFCTHWNDPFFDIAMLAVTGGYTQQDEHCFFKIYLGRDLTDDEYDRYCVIKKITFIYAGLWCCFSACQSIKQGACIRLCDDVQRYGYYSALFNDNKMSAQDAYEGCKAALRQACELGKRPFVK